MKARNDSKGYERGALGIDDKYGENFVNAGRDRAAEKAMYGRCHPQWEDGGLRDVNGTKETSRSGYDTAPDYDAIGGSGLTVKRKGSPFR